MQSTKSLEKMLISGSINNKNVVQQLLENSNFTRDNIGLINTTYYNDNIVVRIKSLEMERTHESRFKKLFYNLGLSPKTITDKHEYEVVQKINGVHPTDKSYLPKIIKALEPIHSLPTNGKSSSITKQIDIFLAQSKKSFDTYEHLYEITKIVDSHPICLSHGDLIPGNIIVDGEKIYFIDFELAGYHSKYWDLAALHLCFDEIQNADNIGIIQAAVAFDYIRYIWAISNKRDLDELGKFFINRAINSYQLLN